MNVLLSPRTQRGPRGKRVLRGEAESKPAPSRSVPGSRRLHARIASRLSLGLRARIASRLGLELHARSVLKLSLG